QRRAAVGRGVAEADVVKHDMPLDARQGHGLGRVLNRRASVEQFETPDSGADERLVTGIEAPQRIDRSGDGERIEEKGGKLARRKLIAHHQMAAMPKDKDERRERSEGQDTP